MSSIMTNSAAMTALNTLQNINKNMETTQSRISTGFKVATASDNAAYWSIATTMRSDNAALSAVDDALGLGAATVDVAYTAMDSAIDVANEIKTKLVAAQTPGVDRGKIQSEITELQNQLKSVADSASFNEENWLSVDSSAAGYNATKSIVSSFTRSGGAVSVSTVDVDTANTKLYDANDQSGILDKDRTAGGSTIALADIDISALTDSAADLTTLEEYTSIVDAAVLDMTDAATNLGAVKTRVDLQKDFVSNLMDAVDRGVGTLVDADMTEESTRLQALQTQQQLGIQALSIANSNSQNILSLFR
jgi:flagellin